MTTAVRPTGFGITLPEGFVTIPVTWEGAAEVDQVAGRLAELFGRPSDDSSAVEVASFLTATGLLAGAEGVDQLAAGFFRSPDADRPVSVLVSCTSMASNQSAEVAIAGLLEIVQAGGGGSAEVVEIEAGRAVVAVREQQFALPAPEGAEPVVVHKRELTAWIPDPMGFLIAVVSVSSPSVADWAHVCDLALDVFDSFHWDADHEAH